MSLARTFRQTGPCFCIYRACSICFLILILFLPSPFFMSTHFRQIWAVLNGGLTARAGLASWAYNSLFSPHFECAVHPISFERTWMKLWSYSPLFRFLIVCRSALTFILCLNCLHVALISHFIFCIHSSLVSHSVQVDSSVCFLLLLCPILPQFCSVWFCTGLLLVLAGSGCMRGDWATAEDTVSCL